MEYVAYKMVFPKGVHFGSKTVEDSESTFAADTLFSALCQEAMRFGEDRLELLYQKVCKGEIRLSDGFPYIGDTMYIPKPVIKIQREENGDSKVKKAFKQLSFIPMEQLEVYLAGDMDVEREKEKLGSFGAVASKTSASIRGEEETRPYHVGIYQYNEGNGLYIIIGYQAESDREWLEQLLTALSYSGLGGRRHAGFGRFGWQAVELRNEFVNRMEKEGKRYMTLSVSLPQEDELDEVLDGANYMILKRSGFVASDRYADTFLKKRDLYVFSAGACVKKRYQGAVYDVSSGGSHPVYRYAKPMFLEVSL